MQLLETKEAAKSTFVDAFRITNGEGIKARRGESMKDFDSDNSLTSIPKELNPLRGSFTGGALLPQVALGVMHILPLSG